MSLVKTCQKCGDEFRRGPTARDRDRFDRAVCGGCDQLTAESITDRDIRDLRDALPTGHADAQWCADALASHDHPLRRRNARRICAEIINARSRQ